MTSKKRKAKKSKRMISTDRRIAQPKIAKTSGRRASGFLIDEPTNEEKQHLLAIHHSISESFSGPLPPPEDFARYGKVLPDAPERIMTMAEKEQQMRKEDQDAQNSNERKSIFGATLVAFGLIGVAALATWLGSAIIAVPVGFAGVIQLVIQILYDRWRQKTDRNTD